MVNHNKRIKMLFMQFCNVSYSTSLNKLDMQNINDTLVYSIENRPRIIREIGSSRKTDIVVRKTLYYEFI